MRARAMWCSARRGLAAALDLATLDGTNGFRLDGIDAFDSQRLLRRLGGGRQWRRLRRPDRSGPLAAMRAATPIGRELCGVRQGVGLCRRARSRDARRHERLPARRHRSERSERPFRRLGGGRQRRRLRRPDRRGPYGGDAGRRPMRARAMWCSARRTGLPPRSISRRSTARTASGSIGIDAYDQSGFSVVLGGGRQRRRLRRPDRRGAVLPTTGRRPMRARAMWCSARRLGPARRRSISRRSTARTASGSIGIDADDRSGFSVVLGGGRQRRRLRRPDRRGAFGESAAATERARAMWCSAAISLAAYVRRHAGDDTLTGTRRGRDLRRRPGRRHAHRQRRRRRLPGRRRR